MADPTAQLRGENRELRRRLKGFVDQARENEEKMRRFNELELRLISATSPEALLELVVEDYRSAFRLDAITLQLLDPEYELSRMLEASRVDPDQLPGLILESDGQRLAALFGNAASPLLGPYREFPHSPLFPDADPPPRSVALLPLMRRGELIGALHLGSRDPRRFMEESATDFLQRLAAVTAICLENCANHQRLKQVGLTDPLTRVNNRRYFDQRLEEEAAAAVRHERPLACLLLDVDHFKTVNDTLGHQTGDWVLREVAMLIGGQLRRSDTLCRYGGEEFVALLPETELEEAAAIAERIRADIEAHPFRTSASQTTRATISIGVALLANTPQPDTHALVEAADQALYRAKAGGRNRVETAPV